ncbi:RNA polymerase sigma factor [Agromyces sp. ZXT2-6]|uniref:RNA polymerase sigma factor n=1 Tax=Agromyces sp. ZXT2-6 TaxID=3461153 RepID=UPI004054E113
MDDAADRAPSLLDPPPVIENASDAELVEAARTGDSFAITLLWQRHLSVAWTAARAASGRPDAEPVVVRTAELLIAELRDGRGPSGAVRPHLLALVRRAVADAEGAADPSANGATDRDPAAGPAPALERAPVETYRDILPDAIGDGTALAASYTSLPTRWQEALWLAEVDGLPTAEVAAELGLTAEAVQSMLADARSALRTEWSSLRLAALPEDAPCRTAAAVPQQGRRTRAHLDECDGCRALAAPPESVSGRAMATMPLLLLGAGGGIAFLESLRKGASAAATEPVPSVSETAAAVAEAAAADAAAADPAVPQPSSGLVALAATLAVAIRSAPRRRVVTAGAALAGIAAATAFVTSLAAWNGGADDPSALLADPGATSDVAEAAPHLLPPEVMATDLPDDAETNPPTAAPDASPDADPESDGADREPAPAPGDEGGSVDGTGDASSGDAAPRPGSSPSSSDGPQSIDAPRPPAAGDDRAPLDAELGRPGANGWRTLTVTGEPNEPFTVASGGDVLYTGVLDSSGSAELQVRGTGGDVESLALAYGTAGDTSYAAATTEPAPSQETARRGRTASPEPAP